MKGIFFVRAIVIKRGEMEHFYRIFIEDIALLSASYSSIDLTPGTSISLYIRVCVDMYMCVYVW